MHALTKRQLTDEEVGMLRAGSPQIDLQLAACLEGESLVFSAHRPTSTVVVAHDNPGGTEAWIFEGGTEWDRRQAGLEVVGKVMAKAEARGIKCQRL